jgi:hypothetical protein
MITAVTIIAIAAFLAIVAIVESIPFRVATIDALLYKVVGVANQIGGRSSGFSQDLAALFEVEDFGSGRVGC